MIEIGIILSIVVGYIRGGSLDRLSQVGIRFYFLIIGSFLLQAAIPFLAKYLPNPRLFSLILLLISYFMLLAAAVINRKDNFVFLIAIGVFLNFLVIALNGGMPVSLKAASFVGINVQDLKHSLLTDFKHVIMTSSTRLSFLGDIIPLPKPYPLAGIVSVGDFFMTVGAFLYLQEYMVYKGKRKLKNSRKFSKLTKS